MDLPLSLPHSVCPLALCVCLFVCLAVSLSVCLSVCLSVRRSVGLFVLFPLSCPVVRLDRWSYCCSSRLATWAALAGRSPFAARTGDGERGRLHPPTRAGLCGSATRRKEGGPGGGCVGGLRHPAYTLARTPLGRLLIAVGRAAPLSVAWLPLACFLLPSSPLLQMASTVGAREVFGGSWSSILFSLDVAAGLWPLLREGLRPSRLRPGALTRPCAS